MLSAKQIAEIQSGLDADRQFMGEPSTQSRVVREYSPDGLECTIIYSNCPENEIVAAIQNEVSLAESHRYTLEWKVYGHDHPESLTEHLLAAGFEPEPRESVLVLPVTEASLADFAAPAYDIQRVQSAEQMDDYAAICRAAGRTNADAEKNRLVRTLKDHPDQMSIYIAYTAGEPVGCGRVYFMPHSEFAGIYGGNTKPEQRNRGIYTALVAARLREALVRNRRYLIVDALPTSEPILRKRGFEFVTDTQPFLYHPTHQD